MPAGAAGGLRRDEAVGEGLSKGRWTVVKKIGEGGFAEVWEVHDTLAAVEHALKIERLDKRGSKAAVLKTEHRTMRKLQSVPFVCRLVDGGWGSHAGRAFFVTELLGANLAQTQRAAPGHRFALDVVCATGVALLDGLRAIHEAGFIHRDVKPANFVLADRDGGGGALGGGAAWKAIDFGLARRYTAPDGGVLPLRAEFAEFRGSTTYASVNAHLKTDLGRRDDLWSWLYILVEMLDGGLPWKADGRDAETLEREAAKELAAELKQDCVRDPALLTSHVPCPDAFQRISHHLASLDFESQPDYALLRSALTEAAAAFAAAQPPALQPATPPDASGANGAAFPLPAAQPAARSPGEQHGRKRGREPAPESPAQERAHAAGRDKRRRSEAGAEPQQQQQQQQQQPKSRGSSPARSRAEPAREQVNGEAGGGAAGKAGGLSAEAQAAAAALGRLDPSEGVGVVAWLVQELGGARLASRGRGEVAAWLWELSDLASNVARRMRNRT